MQRRCQPLKIHDPVLKCNLFDMLGKLLCYCCEVWTFLGTRTALESMQRIQLGFLKILLRVQVHTKMLHVLAEFGRYPLHVTWQSHAAVANLVSMILAAGANGVPRFLQVTCTSPHHRLEASQEGILAVHTGYSASSVSCGSSPEAHPERQSRQSYSLHAACSANVVQLQSDPPARLRCSGT